MFQETKFPQPRQETVLIKKRSWDIKMCSHRVAALMLRKYILNLQLSYSGRKWMPDPFSSVKVSVNTHADAPCESVANPGFSPGGANPRRRRLLLSDIISKLLKTAWKWKKWTEGASLMPPVRSAIVNMPLNIQSKMLYIWKDKFHNNLKIYISS